WDCTPDHPTPRRRTERRCPGRRADSAFLSAGRRPTVAATADKNNVVRPTSLRRNRDVGRSALFPAAVWVCPNALFGGQRLRVDHPTQPAPSAPAVPRPRGFLSPAGAARCAPARHAAP